MTSSKAMLSMTRTTGNTCSPRNRRCLVCRQVIARTTDRQPNLSELSMWLLPKPEIFISLELPHDRWRHSNNKFGIFEFSTITSSIKVSTCKGSRQRK